MTNKKNNVNSGVLAARIIFLCISLVLVISTVLTVVHLISLSKITDKNLQDKASLTMRYINLDIQYALQASIDLTENIAAMVPQLESYDEMNRIFQDLLPTVPAVFEIYYGTVVSRFDGGFFTAATGWDPYNNNPQWDQIKRPWFIAAMQNPDKTIITEPYEDSSTGKMCVTITHTVRHNN